MGEKKFKVLVINLDKASERMESMKTQLDSLGIDYERVQGNLGTSLSEEEISKIYSEKENLSKYYMPLSVANIGCYSSHLKAWQKIVDDDLDYALVLEDDLCLDAKIADFSKLVGLIDKPWECIKLMNPGQPKKIVRRKKIGNVNGVEYEFVTWRKPPTFAMAQLISRAGAEKLLATRSVFYRPIDVDMQHYWENDLKIYGIIPEMAVPNEHSKTTSIFMKMKRHYPCSKIWYKIKYLARVLTARLP